MIALVFVRRCTEVQRQEIRAPNAPSERSSDPEDSHVGHATVTSTVMDLPLDSLVRITSYHSTATACPSRRTYGSP